MDASLEPIPEWDPNKLTFSINYRPPTGFIAPVLLQKREGDCIKFALKTLLESLAMQKYRMSLHLSMEDIRRTLKYVDKRPEDAFDVIIKKGIFDQMYGKRIYLLHSYEHLTSNETMIQIRSGPLFCTMEFDSERSGWCFPPPPRYVSKPNHAVVLVGKGRENGVSFYMYQSSHGYRAKHNYDGCGRIGTKNVASIKFNLTPYEKLFIPPFPQESCVKRKRQKFTSNINALDAEAIEEAFVEKLGSTEDNKYELQQLFKWMIDKLHCYVKNGDTVVDFCCGSNDFSILMKKKLEETGKMCQFKNFNIMPAKDDFNFQKGDWLKVMAEDVPEQDGSKLIMGLNLPFGVNGSLANCLIDKAIEFKPKLLILIVPVEAERLEKKETPYDLIWLDDTMLNDKSFYLPESVDAKDNTMEQRNKYLPLLYLWSRPDWTARHKLIAKTNDHFELETKNRSTHGGSLKNFDEKSITYGNVDTTVETDLNFETSD